MTIIPSVILSAAKNLNEKKRKITIKMKKTYKKPEIKKVVIDNDISLVMMSGSESSPFGGPFGSKLGDNQSDNQTDPFKNPMV